MSKTGIIYGINGPVVYLKGDSGFKISEMVYVGPEHLVGEIIGLKKGMTTVQVFEETTGLKPGDTVTGTGDAISVLLGPGIIHNIFDGIQRPLEEIAKASGKYISRGVSVDSLDTEKKWNTHIIVKEGDVVGPGSVIAETQETDSILHKSMVPPSITEGTVIKAAPDGDYTILEPIVTIQLNDGSSGGPHLHLDIRDTDTQDPMDPQEWLSPLITDDVAPEVRNLVFYTHEGVMGNTTRRMERKAVRASAGSYSIGESVPVWGDVSFGIEAYDRMTGTTNKYGVHQVDLYIDDSLFFSTYIYRYSFDETRYINSFAEEGVIMRTYIAPGNRLKSIYKQVENRGILHVDEERAYRCRYVLTDYDGNSSSVEFSLIGKLQEPPLPKKEGIYFSYAVDNLYKKDDFGIFVPAGALYENLDFTRRKIPSRKYCSDIHIIAPSVPPLHKAAEISVRLTEDKLSDKRQYYLVRLDDDRSYPVCGEYANGWYKAKITEFGSYAVSVDTLPPTILPIAPDKWSTREKVILKISDDQSGLKSYRGEIDGKFVLFELDGKTDRISYRLESNRVKKGSEHTLHVVVYDMCGNEQSYTNSFVW